MQPADFSGLDGGFITLIYLVWMTTMQSVEIDIQKKLTFKAIWNYLAVLPAAMQIFVMLSNVFGIVSLGPIFRTIIETWSLWVRNFWIHVLPDLGSISLIAPEAIYDMLAAAVFFLGFGVYNLYMVAFRSQHPLLSAPSSVFAALVNIVTVAIVLTNVVSNRGGFTTFDEAFGTFITGLGYAASIVVAMFAVSIAAFWLLSRFHRTGLPFTVFHFRFMLLLFAVTVGVILYMEGFGPGDNFLFMGALAFCLIMVAFQFLILILTPIISPDRVFRFAICLTIFITLAIVSGLIESGWAIFKNPTAE